jgi:hypothetical protein
VSVRYTDRESVEQFERFHKEDFLRRAHALVERVGS